MLPKIVIKSSTLKVQEIYERMDFVWVLEGHTHKAGISVE